MSSIKIPFLGTLDSEALEAYYDAEGALNSSAIHIDLNFDNKTIDIKKLELVKQFIDNIRIHDLNNKKYIQKDFEDEGSETVRPYIEDHLQELPSDDLDELIGSNIKSTDKPARLLSKLQLYRVGLYPDNENTFAVFDYTIGKELTDYLVVVNTDENGNLSYMAIES